MKKTKLFFLVLFLVLTILSCGKSPTSSTDEGIKLPSNVVSYKSDVIYQKGQYVYRSVSSSSLQLSAKTRASGSSDGVYQATTRIVGKDPAVFVISEKAPLNPWKVASLSAAQSALENKDTTPTITVPEWNAVDTYLAGAIVRSGNDYYKSLWWNQNNNPSTLANQNGVNNNWGPWKPITKTVAEKELGAETGNSTGTGSTDNNTDPGSDKVETTVPPNAGSSSGAITGDIDSTVVAKYDWKASMVYLENNVCIYGDNYYRAKWWTQGDAPQANPKVAWDTPWQKISEDVFKQLAGGNTPPDKQPANDNTDAGIPPSGNTSGSTTGGGSTGGGSTEGTPGGFASIGGYDWAVSKGYKERWDYNKAPFAALKEKLDAAAIFTKYGLDGTKAAQLFERKLSEAQWGELFKQALTGNGLNGYYSYENFKAALKIIGKYAYVVVRPTKGSWSQQCYVVYKGSGANDAKVRLVFVEGEDFTPSLSSDYTIIDYAAFGEEGTENDKIRVIAGFLAHASHETSGSWATAPGYAFDKNQFPNATFTPDMVSDGKLNGMLAWSLWFNEEVAYKGLSGAHYVDSYNKNFPPYVGDGSRKASSYHGRGAFQLSWNYNYGLASAIFFGDARVLNKYPEFIVDGVPADKIVETGFNSDNWQPNGTTKIEGGTMAFLSSLMFWLTPQGTKPSQQDTMILNTDDGKYVAYIAGRAGTAKLPAKSGLGQPGYGWTINIMNGGYEANKSWEIENSLYDAKVRRRVLHYKLFVAALGGKIDSSEKLDTVGNHSY